jgi:NTP pyrophosphatase (non-canonical NTP hydrolase)
MKPSEYISAAYNTNKTDWSLKDIRANEDLIHGALGACTESAELLDAVKKYLIYDKAVDVVNIKEELGDLAWYMAIICVWGGFDFEDIMEKNIAKLKARYPNRFTNQDALNRDLDKERQILEEE